MSDTFVIKIADINLKVNSYGKELIDFCHDYDILV